MELSVVNARCRSEPFVAEFDQRMLAAAVKCSDDIDFIDEQPEWIADFWQDLKISAAAKQAT